MIAHVMLVLALARGDGLQRAIESLRAGDARAALVAAESEQDDLQRAQAVVYVRHQAGDLEGALVEAERGSLAHPEDPWLSERCAYVALSLKRARIADLALARLESAARLTSEPERTRWIAVLHASQVEVESLERSTRERDAADVRARVVAIGTSAACLALLLALARRA